MSKSERGNQTYERCDNRERARQSLHFGKLKRRDGGRTGASAIE